jgi:hypothetical protein
LKLIAGYLAKFLVDLHSPHALGNPVRDPVEVTPAGPLMQAVSCTIE